MLIKVTISNGQELGAAGGDELLLNKDGITQLSAFDGGSSFMYNVFPERRTRDAKLSVSETPSEVAALINAANNYHFLGCYVYEGNETTGEATIKLIPASEIAFVSAYDSTHSWLFRRTRGGLERILVSGDVDEVITGPEYDEDGYIQIDEEDYIQYDES
jgi:hypothetical protein